jgi:sporulation-control protein spo0M
MSKENKFNFLDLPINIKNLIIIRLSSKKCTNKENCNISNSVKFTNDDYIELNQKPYMQKILKILNKYKILK